MGRSYMTHKELKLHLAGSKPKYYLEEVRTHTRWTFRAVKHVPSTLLTVVVGKFSKPYHTTSLFQAYEDFAKESSKSGDYSIAIGFNTFKKIHKKRAEKRGEVYESLLEQDVVQVTNPKFLDVMKQVDFEDVFNRLETWDDASHYDSYKSAWDELITQPRKPRKERTIIYPTPGLTDEDKTFPDVSSLKPHVASEDKHVDRYTSYAIDFSPWSDIVNSEVAWKSIEKLGKLNVVASTLWEITFSGYSERETGAMAEYIQDLADDARKDFKEDEEEENRD